MAIDSKVAEAIDSAVKGQRQPQKVSNRIKSWMKELSSANTSLDNADDFGPYLEGVLEVIEVDVEDAE